MGRKGKVRARGVTTEPIGSLKNPVGKKLTGLGCFQVQKGGKVRKQARVKFTTTGKKKWK